MIYYINKSKEKRYMVRPIVKDTIFLSQKSVDATVLDKYIAMDLMDMARANAENCVGMAANMIGFNKRIIVYGVDLIQVLMINPVITKKKYPYETEEGCLSLEGTRKTTRYKEIEVTFLDINFQKHKNRYNDWIAQIIQHEVDHCDGILI
jgi:peptide deformylase